MIRAAFHSTSITLAFALASVAHAAPDRIYLVRHAEKDATQSDDPGLSAAGSTRAQQLMSVLQQAGVVAIVVSDTRRSRETVAPLAEALKLQPLVASGRGVAHLDAVLERVRAQPGGAVLVVGHSNTLASLLQRFGGPQLPDLDECEFDALWTLELNPGPVFVTGRYGAPSAC